MDQLKEILRQVVRHRFWIAIGVAALLPTIAYFAAAGPIKKETVEKAAAVESAVKDVQQYESLRSGIPFSDEATQLVTERTSEVNGQVLDSWQLLYEKQAPLLAWPDAVKTNLDVWGRTWPETVDNQMVARTVLDYVQVYPQYVDRVYSTFKPFDFETGEGLVVAAPKDLLLKPATFSMGKPPTLGEIWGAQQKLWIQETVLEVVNDVNRKATTWDNAIVKEITALQVANTDAMDQKSIAQGVTLEPVPEIVKPGTAAAPATATDSSGYGDTAAAYYAASGGGPASKPDTVYILKPATPDQKYQEIPVHVALLVEQNRILDVIAAFENSPMSIKVVDIEVSRPEKAVERPEEGEDASARFASYGRGGFGERVLGSKFAMMASMSSGASESMARSGMGMKSGYMGGMGGGPAVTRKGTDIRQDQLKKLREKDAGKAEDATAEETAAETPPVDYFNIVEVKIYGHARFYNKPPEVVETPAVESAGAEPEAAETDATATAAPDAAEPPAMPADTATEPADTATTEPAPSTEPAATTEPAPSTEPAATTEPAPSTEPATETPQPVPAETSPTPEASPETQPATEPTAPAAGS